VRVPEAVGKGNVRISLSFEDWKDGKVAPATLDIPVFEEPKADGGTR
jgi:hypothetical protein